MVVYGDPSERLSLTAAAEKVRCCLRAGEDIGALREALIRAGQIEQALADSLPNLEPAGARLTDELAAAFVSKWSGGPRLDMTQVLAALKDLKSESAVVLKTPESFAFYALYPEQYVEAVKRWAERHVGREEEGVFVLGVRSIGTTLSALAKAQLSSLGWRCRRATVRPTGHAYHRESHLAKSLVDGFGCGIVLDEGPGLSGSSMASAAEALANASVPESNITLMPSHWNEPGGMGNADDYIRRWWTQAPRIVVPVEELHWHARTLRENLAHETAELCGCEDGQVVIQDFCCGYWRHYVYDSPAEWPCAFTAFERSKYRCLTPDGQAVLWKFQGLNGGAEVAFEWLTSLANEGWTPRPLRVCLGFVGTWWASGRPMECSDLSEQLLRQFADYLACARGTDLMQNEQEAGLSSLEEILFWNSKEALGDEFADLAGQLSQRVRQEFSDYVAPAYSDGRMAPHEWIATNDGSLLKTDCWGHERDHTAVGRQCFLWDVAATIVEWELDPDQQDQFCKALGAKGLSGPDGLLRYFLAAYAAFRLGMSDLGRAQTGDELEKERLSRSYSTYEKVLRRVLETR